jgi:tetratricopeptide (TPR) repeat protein
VSDLTNRDLIFCPAGCRAAGRESPLRLESVGYLTRLRAVSFACATCGHTTAVSLRNGAFSPPVPGCCWNCSVAFAADATSCDSCGVDPRTASAAASGIFFTFPLAELEALRDEPREALVERLGAARRARRLTTALAAADALTHRYGDEAASWRAKSELYLEHGFLPLALHAIKRALTLAPDDLDTGLQFAAVLELLDQLEDAIAVVAAAQARAPQSARPPAMLASLYEKLERFDEAAAAARESVRLDPGRADAWAAIATLHMRRKEYAPAAAAWDRALHASPEATLAWRYKGFCHLALREWPAALAAALRCGEGDEEALEIGFEARLGPGDAAAALDHARRCNALFPDSARFLYLEARALLALGRHAEGLAVCDRILALEPGAEWAKKARAMFLGKLAGTSEALSR